MHGYMTAAQFVGLITQISATFLSPVVGISKTKERNYADICVTTNCAAVM